MTHESTAAWITLMDSGISAAVLRRLTDAFGHPVDVLAARDGDWQALAGLNPDQCRRLRETQRDEARREKQLEVFHATGMRLIQETDVEYPVRLSELGTAPPALFVRGELIEEDRLAVALVGPRMATPYGIEVTRRLATELAPIMTIISGLAVGVDSAAHQMALDAGGRTLGVAACGLDQNYPQGTAALRERIPDAGALISMYPPLTKAATHHFPVRNQLIAALSLAVVIVEASEKSGALVTAQAAVEQGREVFAVPGDITRRNSRGSNRLIADGAGVATCAGDVLATLEGILSAELAELKRQREKAAPKASEKNIPPDLPAPQATLLDALMHTQRQYDELMAEYVPAQMTLGEFAGALLQLEIKGLIKQLPGKIYLPRV